MPSDADNKRPEGTGPGTAAPDAPVSATATTPPVEEPAREPDDEHTPTASPLDLRAGASLVVLALLVAFAATRSNWVAWIAGPLVLLGLLRALGFVLVAREAGRDPDEGAVAHRVARVEGGPTPEAPSVHAPARSSDES